MSAEIVTNICEAIECRPNASTRCLSSELVISQSSIWKVLHCTLKKKACHVQVHYKQELEDYAAEKAVHYDLCPTDRQGGLMDNVLFSDEATLKNLWN